MIHTGNLSTESSGKIALEIAEKTCYDEAQINRQEKEVFTLMLKASFCMSCGYKYEKNVVI